MSEIIKLANIWKKADMGPSEMLKGLSKVYNKNLNNPKLYDAAKKMSNTQRFDTLKTHIEKQKNPLKNIGVK
jgi:ribosome biogenesis GTPase A